MEKDEGKNVGGGGVKRKLVSLNEANEVARRLAKRHKVRNARRGRGGRRYGEEAQDEDEDESEPQDEVAAWCGWDTQPWCEFVYDKEGRMLKDEEVFDEAGKAVRLG